MKSILLVRHAETNLAGTFCGHSDPALSERGKEQVLALLHRLQSCAIDLIYSSDLQRAHATAQAIAEPRNLEVVASPALREIDFGKWEGLTWVQIEEQDPAFAAAWLARFPAVAAPGGEDLQDFARRVLSAVDAVVRDLQASTMQHVAIVTHAGVMRLLLERLCGMTQQEGWEMSREYCSAVYIGAPETAASGKESELWKLLPFPVCTSDLLL